MNLEFFDSSSFSSSSDDDFLLESDKNYVEDRETEKLVSF